MQPYFSYSFTYKTLELCFAQAPRLRPKKRQSSYFHFQQKKLNTSARLNGGFVRMMSLAIHGYTDVGRRQPPTQSEAFDAVHGAEREPAQQHKSTMGSRW